MDKSIPISYEIPFMSDDAIAAFAAKKIFFGHKSVGNNILDGVKAIVDNNARFQSVAIRELHATEDRSLPGIYHAMNGENRVPKSKCDAFYTVLSNEQLGNSFDFAFFKFCYVDIKDQTDVDELFIYYVHTIDKIKAEYPNLKIVHVTVPLTTHFLGIKDRIKKIIRGDKENVKRNQFNQLLIQKYNKIDPIFNLAKIESTYPDDSRSMFKYKKETYYSLTPMYTSDGGHLNKFGQNFVAKEFLKFLATISLTVRS